MYGSLAKNDLPFKEDSKYCPNSPYAASKASSDHFVRAFNVTYGLPTIITNCSNNYGPNQHPEKLIPKLIYNILNGLPLPIYGDGKNLREWIYVEDTCKAIHKICLKSKIYETYNIGSSVRLKNIDLCKIIYLAKFKNLNNFHSLIEKVYDRPGHDRSYSINSKKLNKNIYKSKVNKKYIKKKLEKTVKWYFINSKWVNSCLINFKDKRLG